MGRSAGFSAWKTAGKVFKKDDQSIYIYKAKSLDSDTCFQRAEYLVMTRNYFWINDHVTL